MTKEEIEAEIDLIKNEGINNDQEDKSMMEEYVDAIAKKRIIEELEQQLKEKDNPVQSKEVVPVYNSLEEITEHLQGIKNSEYKYSKYFNWQDCIQVAIEKLQNTISSGAYIKQDGKE